MQENTGHAEVRDAPLAAPKPRPHWGRRWTGHGIRFTFWSILAACLLFAGLVAATRFWTEIGIIVESGRKLATVVISRPGWICVQKANR